MKVLQKFDKLITFCFSGVVFNTAFCCSSLSALTLAANFADVLTVSTALTLHIVAIIHYTIKLITVWQQYHNTVNLSTNTQVFIWVTMLLNTLTYCIRVLSQFTDIQCAVKFITIQCKLCNICWKCNKPHESTAPDHDKTLLKQNYTAEW